MELGLNGVGRGLARPSSKGRRNVSIGARCGALEALEAANDDRADDASVSDNSEERDRVETRRDVAQDHPSTDERRFGAVKSKVVRPRVRHDSSDSETSPKKRISFTDTDRERGRSRINH